MAKEIKLPVDDDMGMMLNCAVRYALGRRTYAVHDVVRYVTPLIPYLSNRTVSVMERDIREHGDYGDPGIDKPAWMGLLERLQAEITRRKTSGIMI